MNTWLNDGVY